MVTYVLVIMISFSVGPSAGGADIDTSVVFHNRAACDTAAQNINTAFNAKGGEAHCIVVR